MAGLVDSPFRPPWWLRNPHLQTLWGGLRRGPPVPLAWEMVELDDGDFLEIAWVDRPQPDDAPTVVVLHGLTGSVDGGHARGLLRALADRGWRAGVLHFRGCGRRPNRTRLGYHSGQSEDPRAVLLRLRDRLRGPLAAVGFSLGANVLLKLLGEDGPASPLDAAAAVSPPLVLPKCVDRMERGFSRMYMRYLVRRLVDGVRAKHPPPVDLDALDRVRTFRDFDNLVTAPIHGFDDAEHYYRECSSRPFLPHIRVPTLVVHARDDPFFTPDVVPAADEVPEHVRFEVSPTGGHVGFVSGWRRYHVEERVPGWLAERFGG